MNSIAEVISIWRNDSDVHKLIHETFVAKVNQTPQLKDHRTFVENHVFGFGERSFQWMWHLLVKEMPAKFSFMEIGVFKGQILSLVGMLADKMSKQATRYGVTPLSSAGVNWESDYRADIELIHDTFNVSKDYTLIVGDSTEQNTIQQCKGIELDILYIDGGHKYEEAASDIVNYCPLLKKGGFLVIDDCACDMPMPWGYFTGITYVTDAVQDHVKNKEYEFLFNVMHNKVWRKK